MAKVDKYWKLDPNRYDMGKFDRQKHFEITTKAYWNDIDDCWERIITAENHEEILNECKRYNAWEKGRFTNKTFFDRIPSSAKILSGIFRGNVDFRKEFAKNNPDLLDYINSLTEEEQSSNKLMTALNEIGYGNFLASEKGGFDIIISPKSFSKKSTSS